jgi:hypothetical protein
MLPTGTPTVLWSRTGEAGISVIISACALARFGGTGPFTHVLTLIRKPLLFLFVLAVAASLAGGGRLSLRLLLDTATALAVVPIFQVLALAVVFWTGRRPLRFGPAVDAYFDGSGPWFAALAIVGLFGAVASPVISVQWFTRVAAVAMVAAVVFSVRLDLQFFRTTLGRSRTRAVTDVIGQRAVAWGATLGYLGLSSLPKVASWLPNMASNLFGMRP